MELDGFSQTVGAGSAKRVHRYRWMEDVPLRDSKDALTINWLEIEIVRPNGKVTYRNSFVTDLPVTRKTAAEITAYHLFPSWHILMRTIITGMPPPKTACPSTPPPDKPPNSNPFPAALS
ncbi:hypothetical protein [Parvibaculum sp.]|uniref:hypothetical protein n=1 Tax=Parvibaculum sp. TaxID=2024848 RepID=UPI00320F68A0